MNWTQLSANNHFYMANCLIPSELIRSLSSIQVVVPNNCFSDDTLVVTEKCSFPPVSTGCRVHFRELSGDHASVSRGAVYITRTLIQWRHLTSRLWPSVAGEHWQWRGEEALTFFSTVPWLNRKTRRQMNCISHSSVIHFSRQVIVNGSETTSLWQRTSPFHHCTY